MGSLADGKSLIQLDGGEGCSGSATAYPATDLGRKPPRQGGVPQAHGAMDKNRVRRTWWDEPATQGKILYPSQSRQVYTTSCAQSSCLLREIRWLSAPKVWSRYRGTAGKPGGNRENKHRPEAGAGLGRKQLRPIAMRKSAEGIVVSGNEPGLPTGEVYPEDSPRRRPERCPPEWTRVNDSGQ